MRVVYQSMFGDMQASPPLPCCLVCVALPAVVLVIVGAHIWIYSLRPGSTQRRQRGAEAMA